MTEDYSAADPISQQVPPNPVPTKPSAVHSIFVGPNGIRAGWRLVIFLALDFAFVYGIVHIPGVRSLLPPQQIFTAKGLLFSEGLLNLLPLLLAAAVMTFIEKRSFADYGMPWNETLGKRFWQGVPIGFIMLSLLLLLIGALTRIFHGWHRQWAEWLRSASPFYISSASSSLGSSRNSRFADTCNQLSSQVSDSGRRQSFSRLLSALSTSEIAAKRRSAHSWPDASDSSPHLHCVEPETSGIPLECTLPGIGEKRIFTVLPTAAFSHRDISSTHRSTGRTG